METPITAPKSMKMTFHTLKNQTGVVLFFALLALAVMSIASVALIRGVDTNTLVTGNLVYRQTANATTAIAFERVAQLMSTIAIGDANANVVAKAYFDTCNNFDTTPANNTCRGERLTDINVWNANSQLVPTLTDGNDAITDGTDKFGNTFRFIVERMCAFNMGEDHSLVDPTHCMMAMGAGAETPNSAGGNCAIYGTCLQGSSLQAPTPLYRVTLRISGPKNTVSYAQSFYSN